MIPRTLVPWNVRPAESPSTEPHKTVTALDDRTLIPAYFVQGPLETSTSIPASLPLESIAARVVVPRDLPFRPLEAPAGGRPPAFRAADTRIAIPADAAPPVIALRAPARPEMLPEVVDPDVFNTGNVQLLASPEEPRVPRTFREGSASRVSSVVFHVLLIAFILFEPRVFPERSHAQSQLEISRQNLGMVFLPPALSEPPRIARPAQPPSELMRVDPRVLRRIAPPEMEPKPLPGKPEPERVVNDLPEAPKPQAALPDQLRQQLNPTRPTPRLESPDDQPKPPGLILPKISPGRGLEESAREGAQDSNSGSIVSGGRVPGTGFPGGGGGATAYSGIQMLTPTEGVDFSNYLARVYASVKQNWFAVMPESVRLGEKGVVVLQFRIMRDGTVPGAEPSLMHTSGKEPLDRAAISSIRSSSPFPPLPSAFSGPYIELRFGYWYNLPVNYGQQ